MQPRFWARVISLGSLGLWVAIVPPIAQADTIGHWHSPLILADARAEEAAQLFDQALSLIFSSGQPQQAYPLFERAIELFREQRDPRVAEVLSAAAAAAMQNHDLARGFAWFDDLIAYHRAAENWLAYGEANFQTARWQEIKGDSRESLRYYEQAVDGFRRAGDLDKVGTTYLKIAQYHIANEDVVAALSIYEQLIPLAEQIGNPLDSAWLFHEMGNLYQQFQQGEASVANYRRALAIYQRTPPEGWAAHETDQEQVNRLIVETLQELQRVYLNVLNDPEQAIAVAQARVQLYEPARTPAEMASLRDALSALAQTYESLDQLEPAVNVYQQLMELRDRDRDNFQEYHGATQFLAHHQQALGDNAGAIATMAELVALYRQFGPTDRLALTISELGDIYHAIGDYAERDAQYEAAMAMAQAHDHFFTQTALRARWADRKYDSNEFDTALALLAADLQAARQWDAPDDEARALGRLSNFFSPWMYPLVEDIELSIRYREQANRIFEKNGNYRELGPNLDWLGNLSNFLGNHEEALRYFQRALAAWEKDENRASQQDTLTSIAYTYLESQQPQQTLQALDEAEKLWPAQNWQMLKYRGDAYQQLGQFDRALDAYEQAFFSLNSVALSRTRGDAVWNPYLQLWSAMAAVHCAQDNYPAALTEMQKVIREVEAYSRRLKNPRDRQEYFQSVQKYYEQYIDILMQRHFQEPDAGYAVEALQADENRRAQGLLSLLTEASVDLRQGVDPDLLAREDEVLTQLEALELKRITVLAQAADQTAVNAIERERDRLLQLHQAVKDQLRRANPQYAQIQHPRSLTIEAIQTLLDADTVLLQYALGEAHSYLWLVTRDAIASYELPPRAELESLARQFNRQVRSATPTNRIWESAVAISQPLLAPVADQLEGKRLIIVSDGVLQYVPFAALTQPDRDVYEPLIQHHEMITLPSISTLATLREMTPRKGDFEQVVSILADPVFSTTDERVNQTTQQTLLLNQQVSRAAADAGINWSRLPGTLQEAEAILALVPRDRAQVHLGFEAQRPIVFDPNWGQAQFIHFATHGFVNTETPELSGIVMSLLDENGNPQNGFLRLNDVYNLNLVTELVVLSACETGTGKLERGEGLIGLTRGFMYAGAQRVVASLWQVDDQVTAALMQEFYRQMLTANQSPAEALQLAQRAIAARPEWSSPYYWAAFTLQGDW